MAKIWPVFEGMEPTRGGPWADIPLAQAIELLELDQTRYSAQTPHFGDKTRDLTLSGYQHIVVEVEPTEGKKAGWKSGYYISTVKPDEAFDRLIVQVVKDGLGTENVVRLKIEPTTDSQGQDALKIGVVVTPDAATRISDEALLDTLVDVKARLRGMGEGRLPIIEYTTEAELAQDAGP